VYTPVIPALERLRKENTKFEASLVYIVNFRPVWTAYTVKKKKKVNNSKVTFVRYYLQREKSINYFFEKQSLSAFSFIFLPTSIYFSLFFLPGGSFSRTALVQSWVFVNLFQV
jgi:hypothetical protein